MTGDPVLHTPQAIPSERIAFSPLEVCRLLGIGKTTLYALISSGSLQTVKLGSRRLITRAAIDRLLTMSRPSA